MVSEGSTWEEVERAAKVVLLSINLKASPGFPFMRICRTNGELVELLGDSHLASLATTRYFLLKEVSWNSLGGDDGEHPEALSALGLVRYGLADFVRVFIKNELHSSSKAAEGRWRIISSQSLVTQLVERLMCGAQNELEISMYEGLPSLPGMGLHDEGLEVLASRILKLDDPTGSDIMGWDWCLSQELMDLDAKRRAILARAAEEFHMYPKLLRLLGYAVFVLSDGALVAQIARGIMDSGSYLTSSTNSAIRALCAMDDGVPVMSVNLPGAMGDDCFESGRGRSNAAICRSYLRLGMRVKCIQRLSTDGHVEFCSYAFDAGGGFTRVNWGKAVATFFYTWPRPEVFDERFNTLKWDLRHAPAGAWERTSGLILAVAEDLRVAGMQ